jgi:hypothetical protein
MDEIVLGMESNLNEEPRIKLLGIFVLQSMDFMRGFIPMRWKNITGSKPEPGYKPPPANQLEQNNEELKRNMNSLETTIQDQESLKNESEQLLKTVQESYNQMTYVLMDVTISGLREQISKLREKIQELKDMFNSFDTGQQAAPKLCPQAGA